MTVKRGRPWNNFEIESIVSAYKEMLWLQVLQHEFTKSEFNLSVQRKTGRSRASIEFKFRNISAVMSVLQLPELRGYVPAKNFQKALFDCILHWERSGVFKPIVDRLLIRPQRPMDTRIYYVDPPEVETERSNSVASINLQAIRGIHFPSRDDWRYWLGRAGAEYVYHGEIDRLSQSGQSDLSRKVSWVTESEDDDAGFDVLSFDAAGNERRLGVKTTIGTMHSPFFLTSNEFSASEAYQKSYRLIRLFEFGTNPQAFELTPPLTDRLQLTPSVYSASL